MKHASALRRSAPEFLGAFVLYGGAALISDRLLYAGILAPRLDGWSTVPIFWWLVVALPVVAVSGLLGARSGGTRTRLTVCAIAGGIGIVTVLYVLAVLGTEGFRNQPLAETHPIIFSSLAGPVSVVLMGLQGLAAAGARVAAAS